MMAARKKHGLGRGLEALLGDAHPAVDESDADAVQLRTVAIDLIQPGRYQPRKDMRSEPLEDLASSIRAQGIIQPLVVRGLGDGRYEIIAGERRWRAAQMAGLGEVPVVVREVADKGVVAMALIENIQRENLNPLEEASAMARLISEFSMTHQEAASAIGRSRAAVSNMLRLLELNERVKVMLASSEIEMGHARALLSLPNDAQPAAAQLISKKGYSVREAESLVRRLSSPPSKKRAAISAPDPNVRSLQESIAQKLGAHVEIQHSQAGKGKVQIYFSTLDELEGILRHIQ